MTHDGYSETAIKAIIAGAIFFGVMKLTDITIQLTKIANDIHTIAADINFGR